MMPLLIVDGFREAASKLCRFLTVPPRRQFILSQSCDQRFVVGSYDAG